MKAEFGRILGIDKPVKMMVSNFQNFISKILAFAESQPVAKDLISIIEEASDDSPFSPLTNIKNWNERMNI